MSKPGDRTWYEVRTARGNDEYARKVMDNGTLKTFCVGSSEILTALNQQAGSISISRERADSIVELLGETEHSHRDKDSCDYNECEKPGEECMWCAEARPIIAELEDKT